MTIKKIIAAGCALTLVAAPMTGAFAANGIGALIQVTQLKSQFANEEALDGADKQKDLAKPSQRARPKPKKRPAPKPR